MWDLNLGPMLGKLAHHQRGHLPRPEGGFCNWYRAGEDANSALVSSANSLQGSQKPFMSRVKSFLCKGGSGGKLCFWTREDFMVEVLSL